MTDSTNLSKETFYNSNSIEIGSTIYLTNGANVQFQSGWGGGNSALTKLFKLDLNQHQEVFDYNNIEIIYDPTTDILIKDNPDFMKYLKEGGFQNSAFNKHTAGTAIRSKFTKDIYGRTIGVYHILGYNFTNEFKNGDCTFNLKNKDEYDKYEIYFSYLTYQYYTHILKDFYKLPSGKYINLSQIPGTIFCGTDETKLGMAQAVRDFIESTKSPTRDITIFCDMDDKDYSKYIVKEKIIDSFKKKKKELEKKIASASLSTPTSTVPPPSKPSKSFITALKMSTEEHIMRKPHLKQIIDNIDESLVINCGFELNHKIYRAFFFKFKKTSTEIKEKNILLIKSHDVFNIFDVEVDKKENIVIRINQSSGGTCGIELPINKITVRYQQNRYLYT